MDVLGNRLTAFIIDTRHMVNKEKESCSAEITSEWRRKRIHLLPGMIPFVMLFVYHEDPLPLWNLGVVVAVVGCLIIIAGGTQKGIRKRTGENWRRTCLTYAIPPVAILFLFPAKAEYASVIVCTLAFGDSAAALAGIRYGKRKLPWNNDKTWVGLGAFLILAAPVAILAFWKEAGNPEVSLSAAAICGSSAVVLAAFAESLRSRIDDNLRVGLAAAVGVVVADGLIGVI